MWQQPMWHPGMPPPGATPQLVRPSQEQTAASWAVRAQQWAQQRRVYTGMYSAPSYAPTAPGDGNPPPPGVATEQPPVPPPPPPPPPSAPPPAPPSSHSTEPRYYSSAPQTYPAPALPPLPSHPPYPDRHTEQHPKSNPQTGQVESHFHPPPYPHRHPVPPVPPPPCPPPPPPPTQPLEQWEHTEPHTYSHLAPYPPEEYTSPSDTPPPPHHYSYSYVPTHRYQQPYGRDTPEDQEIAPGPSEKDNEEIQLAAKKVLEDQSDSDSDDSDTPSSHRSRRHKRASEEDVLLTRRVYDPSHVYAQQHPPPPPPPAPAPHHEERRPNSPPPVPSHPSLPPEQPPQSFDYGHGFPPPVRFQAPSHPPAPYPYPPGGEWAGPPVPSSEFYPTSPSEEAGGVRRVIPAWLRDDLKKLEKDRQKQVKRGFESEREGDVSAAREWYPGDALGEEMFGPPLPEHLISAHSSQSRFFTSDECRDKFLIEALQTTVTEFLLEVTSIELDNLCSNALADARQLRAKPMVSYDSSSESSQQGEEGVKGDRGRREGKGQTPKKQRREERGSSHTSSQGGPVSERERRHKHKIRSSSHHRKRDRSRSRSKRRGDRVRPRSPHSPHSKHIKKYRP